MPSRRSRPSSRAPVSSSRSGPTVLVLTSDPVLARHLLSVVAAVGLRAEEPATDEDLRRTWRSSAAVLVGADRAARVTELVLPSRPAVYVVGRDGERSETYAWSTRLRAAVATLPDGARDLADALSVLLGESATAGVVAVTGGSGGVGASTLAAALALAGAREGLRTFLLDTDHAGGGIDVLLGAEHLTGWRWSRFDAARGHLGDLGGSLPHCDGVDVLAVDRLGGSGTRLRAEQVVAVIEAASRTHDLVVVDLPRDHGPAQEEVLRRARGAVLVVRADVRGVAAADVAVRSLVPQCRELTVVVRTGRGHALDPELVADALGLPLAGILDEDPAVPAAAERGDPPGQPARSSLARLCGQLLVDLVEVAA